MIVDIFFNNVDKRYNEYIYTETYFIYFLIEVIHDAEDSNISFIRNKIVERYGEINLNKLKKYLDKHFKNNNGKYSTTFKQDEIYIKTKKMQQKLCVLESQTDIEILKKISRYITQQMFDHSEALILSAALMKKKRELSYDICESFYYDFLCHKDKYEILVDSAINQIDESYDDLPLYCIVENKSVVELLLANGLSKIGDLKGLSVASLFIVLSIDFKAIIESFKALKYDFFSTYKKMINSVFSDLDKRELEILSYRNGFYGNKPKTLEETGSLYEFTRERCRQIEARATAKIKNGANKLKFVLFNLFFSICSSDKKYFSEEELSKFIADEKITKYVLFMYENCYLEIVYNHDLKVVYNSLLTSIADICDEILKVRDDLISISEYAYLSTFEKTVINYSYKLYKDIIYVKKGMSTKELISLTIDDLFPNGYRISNQGDYLKLHEEFKKRYGDIDDFPSDRSIVGFLDRLDYCQIEKGTYKNRKYCIKLPQYLMDEIINYILLNQPAIYYSSIYEKYKINLNALGINNYYYLKGAIDPFLPSDFTTKRNYIMVGEEKLSITKTIINYMKSFNGQFTIEQLKNKFIGVKEYTFLNVIYNEGEKGLIPLGNGRYVYIDKVVITEDTVKDFKKIISDIFALMNTNVISARKIYARLSLLNKDLLNRLKIATDSFSTFSLVYYFFKNDYGFNRPLISLNKNENVNQYILISNYVSEFEIFNIKTIKNYVSKMNLRDLYSYLEFMEDQSDNYVQINVDTMVSKTKFALSEENYKDIEKMLELIFARFDEIDTRKFNGYAMLPKFNYVWNKYLLAGIIRSFFDETYEVNNTQNVYDETDFIIRRIK